MSTENVPALASAIVIPDAVGLPRTTESPRADTPLASAKRRRSDASDNDPKRRRTSADEDGAASQSQQADRRKSRQVEEKKRGQRLFGALLGTLSQGSSNAAQKRRADIEKRQQAKLKQQVEEDSRARKARLDQLHIDRSKKQITHNEQTMWQRHKNVLHYVNFLQTKAKPMLYYKPWELTSEQEDQIERQLKDAQAKIDRELDAFEQQRAELEHAGAQQAHSRGGDSAVPEADKVRAELTEEAAKPLSHTTEINTNPSDTHAEAAEAAGTIPDSIDDQGTVQAAAAVADEQQMSDAVDEDAGEEVVEADEDTVIY